MVVDSSAALTWAFSDEKSVASQALYFQAAQRGIHVPSIWPFEVANKLDLGRRKGRLTEQELLEVLATFQLLDIRVHAPDALPSLVESAQRFGLTAYDASFVSLALRVDQPLATFDSKMRAAAVAAGVNVLP